MGKTSRDATFDIAKGLGILLVVFFHAYRGIIEAGGHFRDRALPALDYLTYCFHMPLFFVIAGLFVDHSLRRGRSAYIRDKLIFIYYPYILWSVVSIILATVLAGYVNKPRELADLVWIPIEPKMHFWFLLTLFAFFIVYAFVRDMRILIPAAIAAAIVHDLPGTPYQALYYAHFGIFFVAGIWIARRGQNITWHGWWASTAVLLGSAALGYGYGLPSLSALLIPAGFAGFHIMILFSRMIAQNAAVGRALAWLGERSLAVYLLHILASSGTRIAAHKVFGHINPYAMLALCFIVGVALPIVAYELARRTRLLTLTGLGKDPPGDRVGQSAIAPALP